MLTITDEMFEAAITAHEAAAAEAAAAGSHISDAAFEKFGVTGLSSKLDSTEWLVGPEITNAIAVGIVMGLEFHRLADESTEEVEA